MTITEQTKAAEPGEETDAKPHDLYQHNVFWICFWVGAVVPMATVSAASTMLAQQRLQELPIVLTIWISVAIISVVSVICSAVMMISSRQRPSRGA